MSVGDRQRVQTVGVRALPGTRWGALAAALGLSSDELVVEFGERTQALSDDTVVGSPPLVHGATVRPRVAGEVPTRGAAPVTLRVTSGPDAGGSYPLHPGGQLTLGRGSWCDVVIEDPGLSRHHLTLTTTRHGILVEDSASTNGTRVGAALMTEPTLWTPGEPLCVGTTVLALVPSTAHLPRSEPDDEGKLVVTPRTQPPVPLQPVELDLPTHNAPTAPVAPAALGWLIPLAVSVVLAVVLSMPALLLFGLMAPAMALGSHASERRRFRRETVAADHAYEQALRAVREVGRKAVSTELHHREQRSPDLARLLESASGSDTLLWSRSSEALTCRLGVGTLPTGVTVGGMPEVAEHVPIEVDLRRGLSLVGPPALTRALARGVLIQLAVLHAPTELSLAVGDPAAERGDPVRATWDWVAWLPHAAPGLRSRHLLRLHDLTTPAARSRRPGSPGTASPPAGGDPARPRASPSTEPPGEQPHQIPLVLCHTESQALDGTAIVAVRSFGLEISTAAGHTVTGTADLLCPRRAHRAARLLAPLRDGASGDGPGAVPASVDLSSITGSVCAETLIERWAREPRSTRFLVGQDKNSTVSLDLAADGPHALVAGTTGAGKSELLRTLVTSLALVNRPDELVMVLVDYKGGSAFAEAAALPHVVGMITDLDPHLADRALTSLTAELKRRERILADVGVPDLPAYQGLGLEPVPRLVIVIDEFRALAEELPDFLDGLVRIAALGRSLGVHLVLATQRPGGVVSADVRANVNLRIALRVRDGSDSFDVIDSPAAADLPEGIPGRALIRTGADAPRTVQVASSSTPTTPRTDEFAPISVVPVHDLWAHDQHPVHEPPGEESSSTLARAITGTTEAAARLGAVAPPSPWLPALPDVVSLDNLPGNHEAGGWGVIPLMVLDLPAQQRQDAHPWQPLLEGHLGVAGAARSGRSTVARTILAGLLSHDPSQVHIFAFDLSGSLGPISAAPHVGAVLSVQEVTRGVRVLEHLTQLVSERQRDLAVSGFTSLQEQRERSDRPWPLVVLVIDGWARFTEIYGETDRGRPLDRVLQVLREGLSVGIIALVTGDRSLLAGRIAPLLSEVWALRLTDPSDLLMAGLTRSQVPDRMPPGRAVRLRDGVLGQVGVVGGSADGADQVRALGRLVTGCARVSDGMRGPQLFRALPREVSVEELDPTPADTLLLGLGGDAAEPVGLPVPSSGATVLGIVGPPRSGRSWALRTVEYAATSQGWQVVPVTDDLLHNPTALEERVGTQEGSAAAERGLLVTVDELDRLTGSAAEDVLLTWLDRSPRAPGGGGPRLLVVTGAPEHLGGFRGLASRLARDRSGLILQPETATDGSGLGVAVPTGDEPLPGRGVLVVRGSCTSVQVARPPDGVSAP